MSCDRSIIMRMHDMTAWCAAPAAARLRPGAQDNAPIYKVSIPLSGAHPVRQVLLLEGQQTARVEQQRRVGRLVRVLHRVICCIGNASFIGLITSCQASTRGLRECISHSVQQVSQCDLRWL